MTGENLDRKPIRVSEKYFGKVSLLFFFAYLTCDICSRGDSRVGIGGKNYWSPKSFVREVVVIFREGFGRRLDDVSCFWAGGGQVHGGI